MCGPIAPLRIPARTLVGSDNASASTTARPMKPFAPMTSVGGIIIDPTPQKLRANCSNGKAAEHSLANLVRRQRIMRLLALNVDFYHKATHYVLKYPGKA